MRPFHPWFHHAHNGQLGRPPNFCPKNFYSKARKPPEALETKAHLRGLQTMERSEITPVQSEPKVRKKYRKRALEMLTLARNARTEEIRSAYLNLAASWDALAKQGGHFS